MQDMAQISHIHERGPSKLKFELVASIQVKRTMRKCSLNDIWIDYRLKSNTGTKPPLKWGNKCLKGVQTVEDLHHNGIKKTYRNQNKLLQYLFIKTITCMW